MMLVVRGVVLNNISLYLSKEKKIRDEFVKILSGFY